MKKPKLDYGYGFNETNSIIVVWTIDDIKSLKGSFDHRDVDLTDEECMEILQIVKNNHDAEIGINWEVLCFWYDDYLKETGKWVDK